MARRRGDGTPGLIDRVRWGNVGRLAAVLAAGLLIALGPGSCGAGGAKPVAQPKGLLPDPSAAGDGYGPTPTDQNGDAGPRAVSDEEKKPKRRRRKRHPKPERTRSLAKERPAAPAQPARPYRSSPPRRRYYTAPSRRYYSAPRRPYVPHYSPPPEPPRGTPEFL